MVKNVCGSTSTQHTPRRGDLSLCADFFEREATCASPLSLGCVVMRKVLNLTAPPVARDRERVVLCFTERKETEREERPFFPFPFCVLFFIDPPTGSKVILFPSWGELGGLRLWIPATKPTSYRTVA